MLENEKDYMYLKDPTCTFLKWILKAINSSCFVSVLKEGLHTVPTFIFCCMIYMYISKIVSIAIFMKIFLHALHTFIFIIHCNHVLNVKFFLYLYFRQ